MRSRRESGHCLPRPLQNCAGPGCRPLSPIADARLAEPHLWPMRPAGTWCRLVSRMQAVVALMAFHTNRTAKSRSVLLPEAGGRVSAAGCLHPKTLTPSWTPMFRTKTRVWPRTLGASSMRRQSGPPRQLTKVNLRTEHGRTMAELRRTMATRQAPHPCVPLRALPSSASAAERP